MILHVIFGVFSLAWGALGLWFAVAPVPALARTRRAFFDPWRRFWIAQATLLIGLLLIIGTASLEGRWLWAVCGGVGVVKGCVWLGVTEALRDRMWRWVDRCPAWLVRCDGALGVMLAVLLAADVMLHG